jgi:hypothetical protein
MVGLIEPYDDTERDRGAEVDFSHQRPQHVAGLFAMRY